MPATSAWWAWLAPRITLVVMVVWPAFGSAPGQPGEGMSLTARAPMTQAVCVDGGNSGRPFAGVTCLRTVTTLQEAVEGLGPRSLVVVRAFPSSDPNSINGIGTYRDRGLHQAPLNGTQADPIIIQAEGFNTSGRFVKPIVDGAARVTGAWTRSEGTAATWQTPWEIAPASFGHAACVDRIWVSRVAGKTALADFPLTRPLFNQGNDFLDDCPNNTSQGQGMTPQHVDAFPGSYQWLGGVLYVHLPGGEDPNRYTVEVPYQLSLTPREGSSGLVVRGFRVYHTNNGIDLYHCGSSPADRCEATFNETSFNTHFGLQPGRYSLLARNSGTLNTIQLVKLTGDNAEVAYNIVGPQLSHGFKLHAVHDCQVHHNEIYGNTLSPAPTGTQAGWRILGTRDTTAGIYIKSGTTGCQVFDNYVHHNATGIYLRNDDGGVTQGNALVGNKLYHNETAIAWRDDGMWTYNLSTRNLYSWGARFRWADSIGTQAEYQSATGADLGR
jgi:parallel beta-helix repeat protein